MAGRTLIAKLHSISLSSRVMSLPLARPSAILRFRPLLAAAAAFDYPLLRLSSTCGAAGLRCFSTRPTTSSLNDPSPNWSNRPPKETILLDGCDFEHWLVVMEPPDPAVTRDEIIDSYIKTLAEVLGRWYVLFLFSSFKSYTVWQKRFTGWIFEALGAGN